MWVNAFNSWLRAFPLINHLAICLQKGSVCCICRRVSLQSLMRGGGAFTLEVSVGGTFIEALVLLQVWVTGPSGGAAAYAIVFTMMLVTYAFCSGICTSWDRQSAALW